MNLKIWTKLSGRLDSFSLISTPGDVKRYYVNEEQPESCVHGDHYQNYITPLFSIVRLNSDSRKESAKVECEFEGEGIILSFQLKGKVSCVATYGSGSMNERQNNIFFHNGSVRCSLAQAESFRVVLSNTYIHQLMGYFPFALTPLLEAHQRNAISLFSHAHMETTLEMEQVISDIEGFYRHEEEGKEMVIEAKVRELLYLQIQQYQKCFKNKNQKIEKYREQMARARYYVENNIDEFPSLHDIARTVGVCDTTLKVAFKHFYGKTVFGYLNEYRLNKALKLLQNSGVSISEVADCAGFKHLSHFSVAFKQRFGISPTEYRRADIYTTS
jgi:AraC-like DNA-binding protein